MRYKEIPQLYCNYCEKPIDNYKKGRIRRSDTKYCNQKCHDDHKTQKSSKQVRAFKEEFGLNMYAFRGLCRKVELIELLGGKCENCGYNKNVAGLDFHHRDPSQKSFEVKIQHLNYKTEEEILEEALKCILLCATCHRELHNPYMGIEYVKRIIGLQENLQNKRI